MSRGLLMKAMRIVRMVSYMVSNACQDLTDIIQYYLYPSKRGRIAIIRIMKLLKFQFKKLWQKFRDILPSFFYPRRRKPNLLDIIKKYIFKREFYNSILNLLCTFYRYYILVILIILIIYLIIKFLNFFFFSTRR